MMIHWPKPIGGDQKMTNEMRTTLDYLEMVRSKITEETGERASNYRIAKTLGMTQGSMNRYTKKRGAMDSKASIKVARFLNIPELEVIAATEAERAKAEEDKAFWASVFAEQRGRGYSLLPEIVEI